MPSENNKNNDFQLVDDPQEINRLLSEASLVLAKATIWTKNQDYLFHSKLKELRKRDKILIFPLPTLVEADQFKNSLYNLKTLQTFFCIQHPELNLYFSAPFKVMNPLGLQFEAPSTLHKVQRRANARLQIPFTMAMPLTFLDPLFPGQTLTKKILDVSSTGLSFLTSTVDSPMFIPGLILEQLHFKIHGKEITTSGEVRYVKSFTAPNDVPGLKAGVRFQTLHKAESDFIDWYVNEEIKKLYMRLL